MFKMFLNFFRDTDMTMATNKILRHSLSSRLHFRILSIRIGLVNALNLWQGRLQNSIIPEQNGNILSQRMTSCIMHDKEFMHVCIVHVAIVERDGALKLLKIQNVKVIVYTLQRYFGNS